MSNNQNNPQDIKMFKVLIGYDKKDLKNMPVGIPWDMLNEEQAKRNHSQTLTRLNERGGMCVTEILANVYKQSKRNWTVTQETVDELNKLVFDFLNPTEAPQVKSYLECLKEAQEQGPNKLVERALALYIAPFQSRITQLEASLNESNDMYDKDIKLLRGKASELLEKFDKLQADNDVLKAFTLELESHNEQLEKQNSELREALDLILTEVNHSVQNKDVALNNIYELAGQALNSKENG